MARQTPTNAPTPRQLDVLRFVAGFLASHRYSPTVREIGAGLGIRSTNGVNELLEQLVRKGLAERTPRTQRTLFVTDSGRRWLSMAAA